MSIMKQHDGYMHPNSEGDKYIPQISPAQVPISKCCCSEDIQQLQHGYLCCSRQIKHECSEISQQIEATIWGENVNLSVDRNASSRAE